MTAQWLLVSAETEEVAIAAAAKVFIFSIKITNYITLIAKYL